MVSKERRFGTDSDCFQGGIHLIGQFKRTECKIQNKDENEHES